MRTEESAVNTYYADNASSGGKKSAVQRTGRKPETAIYPCADWKMVGNESCHTGTVLLTADALFEDSLEPLFPAPSPTTARI